MNGILRPITTTYHRSLTCRGNTSSAEVLRFPLMRSKVLISRTNSVLGSCAQSIVMGGPSRTLGLSPSTTGYSLTSRKANSTLLCCVKSWVSPFVLIERYCVVTRSALWISGIISPAGADCRRFCILDSRPPSGKSSCSICASAGNEADRCLVSCLSVDVRRRGRASRSSLD